jgi:hypothetical protein
MRLIQKVERQTLDRVIKRVFILPLLIIAAFGALVAKAVTGQREASGEVMVELCQKEGGVWKVIDRMKAAATFRASVAELASGKEARTDFTWTGTSEKGRKLSVRWSGPAKFKFDPARGLLEVNVTFDTSIDGRKINIPAKLTTESLSSPVGQLSGKSASLSNGVLTAGLVGVAFIRERDLVDKLGVVGQGKLVDKLAEQAVEKRGGGRGPGGIGVNELAVVIKSSGKAVAK